MSLRSRSNWRVAWSWLRLCLRYSSLPRLKRAALDLLRGPSRIVRADR